MSVGEWWFPSHLTEMTREECLELVASLRVGRVAYADDEGPVVLPVNHVLDGESVLFRVSPNSEFAKHLGDGQPASFQVDDFEDFNMSGWSVLIRGTTQLVAEDEPHADANPWAEGDRTLNVRIVPTSVSGRRLLPA